MKKIIKEKHRPVNIVAILIIVMCAWSIGKILFPLQVKEMTREGIKLVIEKVETVDGNSVIYLNGMNEDGSKFQDQSELGWLNVTSNGMFAAWHEEHELSSDKKQLKYRIYIRNSDRYKGTRIELKIKNLVLTETGEKIQEESVADLYKKYPLQQNYIDEIGSGTYQDPMGQQPIDDINEFQVLGVGFSENYQEEETGRTGGGPCLYVRTQLISADNDQWSEADINSLYDQTTTEKIQNFYSTMTSERKENDQSQTTDIVAEISETYFELSNTEKLEHIFPIIKYTKRDKQVTADWDLIVKLK